MRKTFLTIAGLLALAGSLQAGIITQDVSTVLNSGISTTLTFDKYDTSLGGILVSVHVVYGIQLTGANVQMDNDSTSANTGTGIVQNNATAFSSTASLTGTGIVKGSFAIYEEQDFNLDPTTGDVVGHFNATGLGDYANWSPGTLKGSGEGDVSGSLSSYQASGGGTFTTTAKATFFTAASFTGNDGFFEGSTPNGLFYGEIIYDVIPEPGTWLAGGLLLVLVGISMGCSFWRKRSQTVA
jgi:hypothetical protein